MRHKSGPGLRFPGIDWPMPRISRNPGPVRGSRLAISRSLLFNGSDYAAQVASMFLVTPLIASSLGTTGYGQWLILMSVIGYLGLLEMGVSSAGTKFLATALREEDPELFGRRLGAIRRQLGLAGVVAGILMGGAAILAWWLSANGRADPETPWVFLAFLPPTLLTFWLRDRLLVLRAHLCYGLIAATTIARTVLQTALVMYSLNHTQSLLTLALAHAVPQCLCFLAQHFLARRVLSKGHLNRLAPRSDDSRELRSIAGHVFASQLAASLTTKSEPFIVSALAGIALVPIHGIARRITGLLTDAFQTVFGSVLTVTFSRHRETEDTNSVEKELAHYSRLVSYLSGWVCSTLFFCGPPFIEAWLPPDFALSSQLLLILLPAIALRLSSNPMGNFLLAIGRHQLVSRLSIVLGALNLLLMPAFGVVWGITGIFAALATSEVIVFAVLFPRVMSRVIAQPAGSFYARYVLLPLLSGILPVGLIAIVARFLLIPSFGALLLFAAISALPTILMVCIIKVRRQGAS